MCIGSVCTHKQRPNITKRYDLYRIHTPNELIAKLDREDLPPNWQDIPANEPTQEIGDQFLKETEPQFAALQVPSTISARDYNYVVNPNHPALNTSIMLACIDIQC